MTTTKRSANFNKREEELLIKLVLGGDLNIIENKRTDAITSKQKDDAWLKLADKYNASSVYCRPAKALREKYTNIKRYLRKKKRDNPGELLPRENRLMKELQSVIGIGLSVDGLACKTDCDEFILNEDSDGASEDPLKSEIVTEEFDLMSCKSETFTEVSAEIPSISEPITKEAVVVPTTKITYAKDWSNCQPGMLRSKRKNLLNIRKQNTKSAGLKEKFLERQLEITGIEHEARMKEHKLKMKILEIDVKIKEAELRRVKNWIKIEP